MKAGRLKNIMPTYAFNTTSKLLENVNGEICINSAAQARLFDDDEI